MDDVNPTLGNQIPPKTTRNPSKMLILDQKERAKPSVQKISLHSFAIYNFQRSHNHILGMDLTIFFLFIEKRKTKHSMT